MIQLETQNSKLETSRSRRGGFTLFEVLLVLTLISLIVGITSVQFANSLPGARLNSTAGEIAAALRGAKVSAKLNHVSKTLVLDLDAKRYYVENEQMKTIPPEIRVKVINAASEEILEGRHEFIFHPAGIADCDSIVLWNEKRAVRIQIDPVVGSVVLK